MSNSSSLDQFVSIVKTLEQATAHSASSDEALQRVTAELLPHLLDQLRGGDH